MQAVLECRYFSQLDHFSGNTSIHNKNSKVVDRSGSSRDDESPRQVITYRPINAVNNSAQGALGRQPSAFIDVLIKNSEHCFIINV